MFDVSKFWIIRDAISETVQDKDLVTKEDYGLSNGMIPNDLEPVSTSPSLFETFVIPTSHK